MKNILLFLMAALSPFYSFAQIETNTPDLFHPPQQYQSQNTETVYLLDSIHYWKFNTTDSLWSFTERNAYNYDSLGRNSNKFVDYFSPEGITWNSYRWDYQYSRLEDNQTVLTWENGGWVRIRSAIYHYNDNRTLDFIRGLERNDQTLQWQNTYLDKYRYRDTDLLVDTIQNYYWDRQEEEWRLSSFRHNYYSQQLDSVHLLGESSIPLGKPDTRLLYQYNSSGQEKANQELRWDEDEEAYYTKKSREYFFDANNLVDSVHHYLLQWVVDDVLTFQYKTRDENGWVVADTTYLWLNHMTEPQIYQVYHYRYDEYGNRVERDFYQSATFDGGLPLPHHHNYHYYYSPREVITTNISSVATKSDLVCQFSNPYQIGQAIRCLNQQQHDLTARLYDLQGRLRSEEKLGSAEIRDFSIDTPLFPGVYFLQLADGQQILGQYKVMVVD